MHRTLLLAIHFLTCSSVFTQSTVSYQESMEDFTNPDRGFYTPVNGVASDFSPLTVEYLTGLRTEEFTPWQANYAVRTTIIFRHYVLDSYVDQDVIPEPFLDLIQADMDASREAGVRLVLRFSYTITPTTGDCGVWICAPYRDAPKARVLGHISQLAPYLQANEDVILALQSGFIGTWGEQYYTDYFGDVSTQGTMTDQNWADRIEVLEALLDAMPTNRMIQVRYPQIKQKFIYGIDADISSPAMDSTQAHSQEDIARIGFHNDCFLAAADDFGTYWDYGTSATFPSDQTAILKPYSQEDGAFVLVGGETCSDDYNPQNDCESGGGTAIAEFSTLHYSYLNSSYNNAVNNDWEDGGCMDEIKRRLGYRLVLNEGNFTESTTQTGSFSVNMSLTNVGFAAPIAEREIEFVLRSTETLEEFKFPYTGLNSDSRFWFPNESIQLEQTYEIPNTAYVGSFELFIHFKDPVNNNALASRPEYSIQLANNNVWENSTGYNSLQHTLSIIECVGDFNLDGTVGIIDLSILLAQFGCDATCNAEITGDNLVSIADVSLFLSLFGAVCD